MSLPNLFIEWMNKRIHICELIQTIDWDDHLKTLILRGSPSHQKHSTLQRNETDLKKGGWYGVATTDIFRSGWMNCSNLFDLFIGNLTKIKKLLFMITLIRKKGWRNWTKTLRFLYNPNEWYRLLWWRELRTNGTFCFQKKHE